MSETMQTILKRRSVRKYKPDMVPGDLLNQIIEAGTYAATGMGKQSPIIIAVTNKELRDKLSKANAAIMGQGDDFDPFYGAPAVLIVLADKAYPTYLYDGSLAMGNLMLAAADAGLGLSLIHIFAVGNIVAVSEELEPLSRLGLGQRRLCIAPGFRYRVRIHLQVAVFVRYHQIAVISNLNLYGSSGVDEVNGAFHPVSYTHLDVYKRQET